MAEYRTVDARGLKCPMPIVKAKKEIDAIPVGEILRVVATDPGSVLDFQGWMKASTSYELVKQEEGQDEQGRKTFVHLVRRKA
ncbi:MAG: sulfurtransferase TusA family protein [Candidatus Rokuibacteriota bacterium]